MSLMIIRATVKPESVGDVEAGARSVFSALQRACREGVRYESMHYAACKLADGVTFVILLGLIDGTENPLPTIPEYREFLQRLKEWLAGPPIQEQLTVVGSYNLG